MHRIAALVLLTLSMTGLAAAQDGKIVVGNDDHTLAEQGFSNAPDTAKFVENLCDWFTAGAPGNFLAYSDNFGLTGPTLAQTMANLGHTWTVSTAVPFDLPTLQQYDAVFLLKFPADNAVLISYVQSGGHVYLGGGSSPLGVDAALWNTFLLPFDLALMDTLNGVSGNSTIVLNHPLFHGVSGLYQNNGTNVIDLDTGDCLQRVLWSEAGNDLYAASNTSGRLELHAYSATLLAGDTLELSAGMGVADRRAVLAVEDIDGTNVFIQIFLGKFDSNCRWKRAVTIPPGIPTANVTMVLYGIGLSGKIEASNPVLIPFP